MTLRTKLKALLQFADKEEKKFIDEFKAKEVGSTGKLNDWLAKDIIVHITYWNNYYVAKTLATLRDEKPEPCSDFNKVNDEVFEANKNKVWADVLAEFKQAYKSATESIEKTPDEMLLSLDAAWQEGKPLWRVIAGSGYIHPIAHISEYYFKSGYTDYAVKLHEQSVVSARDLSESPEWLGVNTYNLSCFYALSGQHKNAISELREALKLNPDLCEWAKYDSDLKPIRKYKAYKSLLP